jgi:hypothetical protein
MQKYLSSATNINNYDITLEKKLISILLDITLEDETGPPFENQFLFSLTEGGLPKMRTTQKYMQLIYYFDTTILVDYLDRYSKSNPWVKMT